MSLTKPFADYPHFRKVGSMFFLAGQGCRHAATNEYAGVEYDAAGKVSHYDIKAQTVGVFANIEKALDEAGLTPTNIVDVTVFLTTMKDFEAMNLVWNEFFAEHVSPTRTTVAVKELPGDNFVEMKVIAAE